MSIGNLFYIYPVDFVGNSCKIMKKSERAIAKGNNITIHIGGNQK